MKQYKRLLSAILAVMMILTITACGGDKDNKKDNGTADYKVTVLDSQGNPASGVVVRILQGDEEVAMDRVNDDGVIVKNLKKGDYTIELMFTGAANYPYDKSEAVLTADKTSVVIRLFNELGEETTPLYASGEEYAAYTVLLGSTTVPVKASVRNYFLFTPAEAGTYEFSVSNNDLAIGYYGGTHYVQPQSATAVVDNVITMSIRASEVGGNAYVFGLDGVDADTEAVLSIVRIGDPIATIEDLPWTEYKGTNTPAPYTLNLKSGESLKYVDIKGSAEDNQVIFNDQDGYYHFGTKDGPVVLMNLGKNAPYVSLQVIIQGDGLAGGTSIRKYFFDENDEFVKKEDYTPLLNTYFENMDPNAGVYPLTEDLVYIIQNYGKGWWDSTSHDYILTDCNPEIGWMFALCYAD